MPYFSLIFAWSTSPWGIRCDLVEVEIGGQMAFTASIADAPSPRRRFSRAVLFGLVAVSSSLAVAAWLIDSNFSTMASAALPGNTDAAPSFEDRFFPAAMARSAAYNAGLALLRRATPAVAETAVPPPSPPVPQVQLASLDLRAGLPDNDTRAIATSPTPNAGIPLPRSRPAIASLDARPAPAVAQADNARPPADRSLLQKLMASLTPDRGLFGRGPDLAALGYDNQTAVYDISAHAVYMPNGVVLEAHSGLGALRDDPDRVSVPNTGATPPATYDLKLREKDFHGVQAIRMNPVEGSDIWGRSGILVHPFMLGPQGDSNGCVSIKDYDRFLRAFNEGAVNRIVVVPSLKSTVAAQAAASRS